MVFSETLKPRTELGITEKYRLDTAVIRSLHTPIMDMTVIAILGFKIILTVFILLFMLRQNDCFTIYPYLIKESPEDCGAHRLIHLAFS